MNERRNKTLVLLLLIEKTKWKRIHYKMYKNICNYGAITFSHEDMYGIGITDEENLFDCIKNESISSETFHEPDNGLITQQSRFAIETGDNKISCTQSSHIT
ncbi:hypothetical protein CDAR_294321 [Caerostris darwini]|uniref:Uncharacterized protein n=1 Tax=Caerostris darwini TaxID=1538125 RepID=A0AAV4R2J1_9ARAC|nr:hypothetical protein CDAR_294321 [Caerostris darwini]